MYHLGIRNNIEGPPLSELQREEQPVPRRSVYFVSGFGTLRRRENDIATPLTSKTDTAFDTILSRHELRNQQHLLQVVVAKDMSDSVKKINARIPEVKDSKNFSNNNSFNIHKWSF